MRVRTLLLLNAVVLFGLHSLFHALQYVAYPLSLSLLPLYGPSDVGRTLHVVTEAVVGVALVVALTSSECR